MTSWQKKNSKNKTIPDEDDRFWSKNHGESIKYRKRLVEEKEARQHREDALKEIEEGGEGSF